MAPAADTVAQVDAQSKRTTGSTHACDPSRSSRLGREMFALPPHLLGLITSTLGTAISLLGSDTREQRTEPWVVVDRLRTRC